MTYANMTVYVYGQYEAKLVFTDREGALIDEGDSLNWYPFGSYTTTPKES